MNLKQAVIDTKLYNVVSYEEYSNQPDLNNNYSTAVELTIGTEKKVLPVRSPLEKAPGIYNRGYKDDLVLPEANDPQYDAKNIIDLSDVKNMEDLMRKQNQVRDIEREILTTVDDITSPNISSLDSPEMRVVKQAIIKKHMDINKYADRFGSNFANDKRILKTNSITQKMMKRILSNIDVKATLILEDASPDVPNPMGEKIEIVITDNDDTED